MMSTKEMHEYLRLCYECNKEQSCVGCPYNGVKLDILQHLRTGSSAQITEQDLQELQDRFGAFVRFIVEDMLSGEGKRWKTNVVSGSQQEHLHTTGLNIPVRFGDATIN